MNSQETEYLMALSRFQGALLEVLHTGGTSAEMRANLLRAAKSAGLEEYVSGFDDRMLVVASELVRKWGGRLH